MKRFLIVKEASSCWSRVALLIFFLGITSLIQAQDSKVMANFTLNIIKYIGWNENQLQGTFVIGVVGKSEFSNTLRELALNRKIGSQDIEVRDFAKANKVAPCQVLFVGKDAFFDLLAENIIRNCGEKGFLLITEEPNALAKGSVVNFYHEDGKLKFEISDENAKKLNIMYADKLANMAEAKP